MGWQSATTRNLRNGEVSMEFVADTNVIAAAIVKEGATRKILFQGAFDLYSPDYLLDELNRNRGAFLAKSGLTDEAYERVVQTVLSNVSQVPFDAYIPFKENAEKISPDGKDWPFFAVALQRKCAIWTNEKRLKRQETVKVFDTKELLDLMEAQ